MVVLERAAEAADREREGQREDQAIDEAQHVGAGQPFAPHHHVEAEQPAEHAAERRNPAPEPEQLEWILAQPLRVVGEHVEDVRADDPEEDRPAEQRRRRLAIDADLRGAAHHDLELGDDRGPDQDRERLEPIEAEIQRGRLEVGKHGRAWLHREGQSG